MFRDVIRPLVRAINILCVVLLASTYVFTYYDYLHTVTQGGLVDVSGASSRPSGAQLGVVVTHEEITSGFVSPVTR